MKWKDLRSNGIAFPPAYESKQLSIRLRGKEVRLSTEAEELAYAWGKKRATPYVQDPVFQTNFLSDFAKLLPSEYRGIKYSEIDWTPVPPGNWKAVVHDHDFMWIGYWVDKLSNVRKYVWPSDISNLRQARDKQKFELAKKLTRSLPNVRRHIDVGLASDDLRIRKLATVCYLIDNLAMRVGDEKDEDEADTVGASTLRVEHVKFHPNNVEFDFLGKDSVRWQKTLELHGPHNLVRKNLQEFCKNKKGEDLVFDGINSSSVNRFLGTAMKGLTAKVFRTHHATETVQKYLDQYDGFKSDSAPFMKLYRARLANLEAAIRCNHKRTPPKTWESSLEKKQLHLNDLQGKETKTEKQASRMKERVEKLKLDIDLQRRTRDYNLNTSLRGYIDPRVYRKWAGEDWTRIYPKTLQRKFLWATRSKS